MNDDDVKVLRKSSLKIDVHSSPVITNPNIIANFEARKNSISLLILPE